MFCMSKKRFQAYRQLESMDCGPTCLRMILKYYGKDFSLDYLKEQVPFSRSGVSLAGLIDAAEALHFETMAVRMPAAEFLAKAPGPCILHWGKSHYVVLPPQSRPLAGGKVLIADPETGKRRVSMAEFSAKWEKEDGKGVALLLHPLPEFALLEPQSAAGGFRFLMHYLKPFRRSLLKVLLTLGVTSGITLVFPFLTQALVDKGIALKQKNIVVLILFAQLALFLGNILMELVRSWVMLHMNTRITIRIVSDFLLKLIRLPVRFFDARRVGDIQQRILDHQRVELLLSGPTLGTLFSFVSFLVFSVVLGTYSWLILVLFVLMSGFSVGWIFLFFRRRKVVDTEQFSLNAKNQNTLNELVSGMPEIKLNRAEGLQQWRWQAVQEHLYKKNIESLKLTQFQQVGSGFFAQLKNILITFVSALFVINGEMTLGMMLAVSFIIGQMNAPLDQLLSLLQTGQDAKLSLERLAEIHLKEEEIPVKAAQSPPPSDPLPPGDIVFERVCFKYERNWVLKDVDLRIPRGKITALVGPSGGGKTTLLKLLLRFYTPQSGTIRLGDSLLEAVPLDGWRNHTGVVMQDGFLFSDSLAGNITMEERVADPEKLKLAIRLANLENLVESLPQKDETLVGNNGIGLSSGQKQRVLIARAIYRDPEMLFFDEATSALDARNEREIMAQLREFYRGKTVVIIAHRLSTVRQADQIVVLDAQRVVESGSHDSLLRQRGKYFSLVKDQLEMES